MMGIWSDEAARSYARVEADRRRHVPAFGAALGGASARLERVWVSLTGSIGEAACGGADRALAALREHLAKTLWDRDEAPKDDDGRPLPTAADRRAVIEALRTVGVPDEERGDPERVGEAWGRLWDLHEERELPPPRGLLLALVSCDMERAIRRHPRLLVVGEAGSGKTTLLSRVVLTAADGVLGTGPGLGLPASLPLPVMVALSSATDQPLSTRWS